ncbi:hypothetical protein [Aeromonas veronii]|uniref:hypothetical protein n=3 Tax=Aeromonas veronii TaxID=654 RepID=UPI000A7C74CC|nr:hypothetical protein [Aeromonas veronii]MCX0425774.1 hypothetical protein [Aeromonas veronii]HDO1324351.1 hypothetical protein [Aeromonas veronii]
MVMNNPAARLLNILEAGKKQNPAQSCRSVWCNLLDIDPNDKVTFLGKLGKVLALSAEVVDELKKVDGINVERYMHWCQPVERAFSESNFSSKWMDFSQHLNEHVFNYLTMTSDFLSLRAPQAILPINEVDKISSGARDLINEVEAAELPEKIKQYMLTQLKKLLVAADDYKITGSKEVVQIVEETFGHAILKNNLVKPVENHPVAKRFWAYMANAAVITTIATGALELAPAVSKLLPEIQFNQVVEEIEEVDVFEHSDKINSEFFGSKVI